MPPPPPASPTCAHSARPSASKHTSDDGQHYKWSLLPHAGAGAGQEALAGDGNTGTDASGNRILRDIGTHLRDLFKKSFKGVDVKYIDPRLGFLAFCFSSLVFRALSTQKVEL
jgi:hypothetical protein